MLTTLLVEDNASFRKMVWDDLLSWFSSIKVMEASNAEEALNALASDPPDLIFVDVSLPGQNGINLTKEIRTFKQDPVIVMLSSYDFEGYRKAALQSGANGFIDKHSADLAGQISTAVSCFHRSKEAGRSKPGCFSV